MRRGLRLLALLMLSAALECNGASPPGKPVLIGCRSPEKETFTCWWEPGADGGLPTVHRLFYEKEGKKGIHECPDYHSAGNNSCFFGKSYTSIWVEYSLRVVAFNALGNASSDTLEIDVMKILKPNAPENVTVLVDDNPNSPCLHISWKRPSKADRATGWVSLTYELRVKQESSQNWMMFSEVTQNSFKMYSIEPGVTYVVQVRCQLDHSSWSDWSRASLVKIPDHVQNQKPFWILVFIFPLIPLLAVVYILVLKRKIVKQWLLPPVPGPKIRGLDFQLLKSERSEDAGNALIASQNFPPMPMWMDQNEEYLIVSESSDWLLTDLYISQTKRKSLIISAGLHLGPEIQHGASTSGQSDCEKAENYEDETDHFVTTSKFQSEENVSHNEPLQLPPEKQQCPSVNSVSKDAALQQKAACESTVQPLTATGGYVDVQQREDTQKVDVVQWDYSRVKDVNGDSILIPENENVPISSDNQRHEGDAAAEYSRVKDVNSDNVVFLQRHDSDDALCKKKEDHNTECSNQKTKTHHVSDCSKEMCLEKVNNGYVDSVPKFPVE